MRQQAYNTQSLKYLLYVPPNYNPAQKIPLVLFLHGRGESNGGVEAVAKYGIPKEIEDGNDFPFIAVSPQCPPNEWWVLKLRELIELLDEIQKNYTIDEKRVYITGLSMGGYGAWALAIENPYRFAAMAVICGGGEPHYVKVLKHLPVWAFHGDQDDIVSISESQKMVKALQEAGGNVKFTVYEGVNHNSWSQTYSNPELYEWMLSHVL